MNFSMTRDDLLKCAGDSIAKFKALIQSALSKAGVNNPSSINAIEIVGGGMRITVLQQVIQQIFGSNIPLGAKLDDTSLAVGAALIISSKINKEIGGPEEEIEEKSTAMDIESDASPSETVFNIPNSKEISLGFTTEEIQSAIEKEQLMRNNDKEVKELLEVRNKFESFLLEMRSAPTRKHGNLIDATQLNKILTETEDWIYENLSTNKDALVNKYNEVKAVIDSLCSKFYEEINNDKILMEKELEEEEKKFQEEKKLMEENGEGEEFNDTRKLKKADRMRLVMKNKEEGNELFKGNNFKLAAIRYHKSLQHINNFYDLTNDDKEEISKIKLSLYLNLSSCYIKLDSWEQVLRNCNDAITIDNNNVKGYYRRSTYYEHKKDYDKALSDLKKCQEINSANSIEDKLVTKALERIKKEIAKEKNKEKKMWGKAFA